MTVIISMMPPNDDVPQPPAGYVLPSQKKVVAPLPGENNTTDNPALDIIRRKLDAVFANEPSAQEESAEANALSRRSKHQQFMYELSNSGKALAEIQTAWHAYYQALPDGEKHQVWQEFYSAHALATAQPVEKEREALEEQAAHAKLAPTGYPLDVTVEVNEPVIKTKPPEDTPTLPDTPEAPAATVSGPAQTTIEDIRGELLGKIRDRTKPRKTNKGQSLLFGLSMGIVVVGVLSFGFFNERFIAPFITPSRAISSTPLIIDPSTAAVSSSPEIIIPKINVEIPVVYDIPTIEESAIQEGLERGVVHYATTPLPGQKGNGVIFGHSANNILNKGQYKFAFVLLRKLDINDTFYIQKDGKRYVYRIYEKKVVPPTDLSVLNPQDKPSTFTLITCDPPGTSLNRLVIVGEQISPDPAANGASTATPSADKPVELPSNSPTLWSRLTGWIGN